MIKKPTTAPVVAKKDKKDEELLNPVLASTGDVAATSGNSSWELFSLALHFLPPSPSSPPSPV